MSREIKSRCRLSQASLTKLVFMTPRLTTASLQRRLLSRWSFSP